MSKTINLNLDWRFHLGEEVGVDFMGHDDTAWRVVTLPHDWSVEHPFDKSNASGTVYLPGGTAWYRKHFILPEEAAGKRVRITLAVCTSMPVCGSTATTWDSGHTFKPPSPTM